MVMSWSPHGPHGRLMVLMVTPHVVLSQFSHGSLTVLSRFPHSSLTVLSAKGTSEEFAFFFGPILQRDRTWQPQVRWCRRPWLSADQRR